ncbi:hypothetical protein Y032_1153g3700 [Ancylostoma ceylanicum]|uniref:MADF domain-containing protein n=1 Tax=Ancylostoma ceylanicum TaxID=53326 RepID=A0A016W698_9BILA|nr:hypothetical protein Y032_1153g3700 [Ancylostoma ceylanicum]
MVYRVECGDGVNDNDRFTLIDLVQQKEGLWNETEEDYRNNTRRLQLWQEIHDHFLNEENKYIPSKIWNLSC